MSARWDHHPSCPGGCGELGDECRCSRPNPLGSMRVSTAEGCCSTCDGSGTDASAVESGGRCFDCLGTGHPHPKWALCSVGGAVAEDKQ